MLDWDEQSESVKAFLGEVEKLSRAYGLSIIHEDTQGAFKIVSFNEDHLAWLKDAIDNTPESNYSKGKAALGDT